MNLEMLLEQEQKLSEKIKDALSTLKKWFEDKIEEAKKVFQDIKDKVSEKIKVIAGKGTLNKDIVKDGEVLAKKGESSKSVIGKIKVKLVEVKRQCNDVIKDCKEGIKAVSSKNTEKAAERKNSVLKGLRIVSKTIFTISALTVLSDYVTSGTFKNDVEDVKAKYTREESDIMEELLEQVSLIGEEVEVEDTLNLEEEFELDMELDADYL